jgi:hypothetical protein
LTNPGTRVDQWTCFGHDANQEWQMSYVADGGARNWYKLVNLHSSLLLDIVGNSTANGATAVQVDQGSWNDLDSYWHCTVRCI